MAIKNALRELAIPTHQHVVVSGVGCSGKSSQYIHGYAAETLHGRAVPDIGEKQRGGSRFDSAVLNRLLLGRTRLTNVA